MGKFHAVILVASCVSGCSDTCKNNLVSAVNAPGSELRASLFRRDCGATTDFSSQVSLTTGALSGTGNVFIADSDHGAARAALWGGPWVEVRWLSPQHLLIRYDGKARVFAKKDNVSGVRMTYETVAR